MEAININTMHTLSFEKAKALKDAGFPQPEFCFGQRWIHDTLTGPEECIFTRVNLYGKKCFVYSSFATEIDYRDASDFVYIPTEGELLAALGESFFSVIYDKRENKYFVNDDEIGEHVTKNSNPLEALADAYLILHNDQTKTSE